MNGSWLDNWARSRAEKLSRRRAVGVAGVAGMSAAMTRVFPAAAQAGDITCQMAVQALTSAGPSAGVAYAGTLELTVAADGTVDTGSFTPDGGAAVPVVGETSGRALDLRVTFPEGHALVLSGTGERNIVDCSGALSGVFGGPELGDTGSWLVDPAQSQLLNVTPCAEVTCVDPFVLDTTTCQCVCAVGTQPCGDTCVPNCDEGSTLDPSTCSCLPECDLGCPDGQVLDEEACTCVDFCSDPAHPFYCGGECYGHEQTICFGECRDLLLHDPMQCGPDCVICPNGVPCLEGVCECPVGTTYCETIGCTRLSDDSDNCGACGTVCVLPEVCFEGVCALV